MADKESLSFEEALDRLTELVGQLENGSDLVLVYDDNGYTKVFYGKDLDVGFVVSTTFTFLVIFFVQGI